MKKNIKKGFTLIELVVVTALMGIITTAIVMVLQPVRNIYSNVTAKSAEEDAVIILTEYLNNELRYSSNVEVICNNETDITNVLTESIKNDSGEYVYDKFIMISNDTRSSSVKGAGGYTRKGLISSLSSTSACVSDAILDEYNYEFSIEDYSDEEGNESLTIGVEARIMTDNGTAFVPDPDYVYNYSETFKLLNIQEQVGSKDTIEFTVTGEDTDYDTIWILYKEPESDTTAGSSGSGSCGCCSSCTGKKGCGCGCGSCSCGDDEQVANSELVNPNYGDPQMQMIVHVMSIASNTGYWSYSGATISSSASGYNGSQFVVGDFIFYFEESGYLTFTKTKDSSGNEGVTYTYENINNAGGSIEIWIMNGILYTSEPQAQSLTLHLSDEWDSYLGENAIYYVSGNTSTATDSDTTLSVYSGTTTYVTVCKESNYWYPTYSFTINGDDVVNNGYTDATIYYSGISYTDYYVTIHWSSTNDTYYGGTSGYYLTGGDVSSYTASDSSVILESGTNTYVYVVVNESNYSTFVLEGSGLIDRSVTDIYIMNGNAYEGEPTDWVA